MIKINLTNYESIYLDYLEGNLSEIDRHAFELFLNEHPEIQIDGELPVYAVEDTESFSNNFVNQLRIYDENEGINEKTINGFLIASAENILSENKREELATFLLKNPNYLNELVYYQQAKIQPDLSIQYPNKKGLRKGYTRQLFFVSLASIAAVFIGVILLFPSHEVEIKQASTTKMNPVIKKMGQVKKEVSAKNSVLLSNEDSYQFIYNKPVIGESEVLVKLMPNDTVQLIQVTPTNCTFSLQENYTDNKVQKSDPTIKTEFLAFSEMESPIEPVFQFAFKKLRDKIDLRFSKPTDTKQGGFYLKLWNFELSRKVAPKGDLASN